jgi:hypothetical protein
MLTPRAGADVGFPNFLPEDTAEPTLAIHHIEQKPPDLHNRRGCWPLEYMGSSSIHLLFSTSKAESHKLDASSATGRDTPM